jgi:hypothetical protein
MNVHRGSERTHIKQNQASVSHAATDSRTQITLICKVADLLNSTLRTAPNGARRAFSLTFSITQLDGIYRRSPISTFDSAPSSMPIARATTSPSQSPAPGRGGKVASYQRELVLAPPG